MRPEGTVNEGSFGGAFGVIIDGTDDDIVAGKTDGPSRYVIEEFFDTGARLSDVTVEADVTNLLVVKAELKDGPDTFTLYVNPAPDQPEPRTGTVKDDLDIGILIGIGIAAAGAVSVDEIRWGDTFDEVTPTTGAVLRLQPGDANQDLSFDQLDIVQVQISAKYLSGQAATWGEGDWNGAPGGEPGDPPEGDGQFNQLDIVSSLGANKYLTGPYAAIKQGGTQRDSQTSLVYDATTGELSVEPDLGHELTSININSEAGRFIGDKPMPLDGAFDNFDAGNLFKATFGGSFGQLSFGNVLPIGLSEESLTSDLTAVGSLAGGGNLGEVDLIYVPEPCSLLLLLGVLLGLAPRSRHFKTTP